MIHILYDYNVFLLLYCIAKCTKAVVEVLIRCLSIDYILTGVTV